MTSPSFRATSRVLLVDDRGAVLLFLSYGKDHSIAPRWMTPGGGVDAGEDHAAAAVRELREETGLIVDDVDPPFHVSDFAADQRWHPYEQGHWEWFALRSERFDPSDAGWLPDERQDILEHRWWTADELRATADAIEPSDLPDLIDAARRRLTG